MRKMFLLVLVSLNANAGGWVEGVPVSIQKTDYSNKHLLFIKLDKAVAGTGCNNYSGVVVHDENESSQAAMSLAMAALVSGKKFRCYVEDNNCSAVTGNPTTFPVCKYYPTLSN